MKFILALQIVLGLFIITNSLFTLPHINVNQAASSDVSIIIDALHSNAPTPEQIRRAATILTNQKQWLEINTSTIEVNFKAFILCGFALLFFGVIVLIDHVRRDKK